MIGSLAEWQAERIERELTESLTKSLTKSVTKTVRLEIYIDTVHTFPCIACISLLCFLRAGCIMQSVS